MEKKKIRLNRWKITSFILGVLLVVSLFTSGNMIFTSANNVGETAIDFINSDLLQGQATATLEDISLENGLYKLTVLVMGQTNLIYVTKDGKLMFVSPPIPITGVEQVEEPQIPEVPKSDEPEIELFVMSHCPYGTQAEKGILPVVKLLGDKIDFKLKFVYYAMHPAQDEPQEQVRQHCIQEEQNDKFLDYLECFLEDGDSDRCITEIGIDDLTECTERIDQEFDITVNLEDESLWLNGRFPLFNIHKEDNEEYSIGGSPTLVINGEIISVARDSVTLLETICSAFNEAPEECNTVLEPGTPSPGFGWSETGSQNTASCDA